MCCTGDTPGAKCLIPCLFLYTSAGFKHLNENIWLQWLHIRNKYVIWCWQNYRTNNDGIPTQSYLYCCPVRNTIVFDNNSGIYLSKCTIIAYYFGKNKTKQNRGNYLHYINYSMYLSKFVKLWMKAVWKYFVFCSWHIADWNKSYTYVQLQIHCVHFYVQCNVTFLIIAN